MEPEKGRVLALDVGTRRVGVAVSDPLRMTAQGGPTLERYPTKSFVESLAKLVVDWDIKEVAVGLPRGLNGRKGSTYDSVSELIEELRNRWPDIRWTPWEERFTTVEAVNVLKSAPRRKRREKGARDRIAAQLILQSYLQFHDRDEELN